jgi:hypothetical protein
VGRKSESTIMGIHLSLMLCLKAARAASPQKNDRYAAQVAGQSSPRAVCHSDKRVVAWFRLGGRLVVVPRRPDSSCRQGGGNSDRQAPLHDFRRFGLDALPSHRWRRSLATTVMTARFALERWNTFPEKSRKGRGQILHYRIPRYL